MKHIRAFSLILVVSLFSACKQKENAELALTLKPEPNWKLQEVNVSLTNRPDLVSGETMFFWRKWGAKSYSFNKVKCSSSNTLTLTGLSKDRYAVVVYVNKDSVTYSAYIDEIDISSHTTQAFREANFQPVRQYIAVESTGR